MNKEKLLLYADIRDQMNSLQKQEAEVKAEIEQEMESEEVDKVETSFGSFSHLTRTTYEYSDKVKEIDVELKQEKRREEKSGKATSTKKKYLRFVFNNAKDN